MIKLLGNKAVIGKRKYKTKDNSRKVVILKNKVYKFADSEFAKNQNEHEIKLWNKLDRKDRKFFVKLLDYGSDWVCMERIKFKNSRSLKNRDFIDELAEKYGLHDVYSDTNINWGVSNKGIPTIFDYGL